MSKIKEYLDLKFTESLLDIYSELTGLSIAFYTSYDDKEPIYSPKNWPEFCQKVCSIIGHNGCNLDPKRLNTAGLYQCKAGLWCYSYPLIIDETLIGAFIVGHRRVDGKDEQSLKILKQTLIEHKIDEETSNLLINLFSKEKTVKEDSFIGFDIKLLEKLSFIESYVILEHQRSTKEYEKIIAFKNEAVSLAHEFLLPIQSIVANAENLMIESSEIENTELENLAEDVLHEIIKLSYIAENIRGSVLEERDKLKLEFDLVDITQIIGDTARLFQKEANKKDVPIKIIQTNEFEQIWNSFVEISEPYIKQAYFNLIHNAVKYSFTSTTITDRYINIKYDTFKNMFITEISNFGIGILPEELENNLIFNKGYRGKLTRDRSRTGSGFGLGRVKEIIDAHNGRIEVESKKLGIGLKIDPYLTTFRVYLPYTQPKEVNL